MQHSYIRIFASADWHDSPEFHAQVKPAVDYFVQQVQEQKPDLVLLPGDLFVKRGHLNPLELLYVRTKVWELSRVCPVVIIPGNHDEVQSARDVDSVTGMLGLGTVLKQELASGTVERHVSAIDNVYLYTRPGYDRIEIPCRAHAAGCTRTVQILACPYPSRTLWTPGKEMSAHEAHVIMGDMVGSTIRALAEKIEPDLPSIFLFHGSIDQGKAGPEVHMTSELEVVVRQGDLPEQATVCIGGHLHMPQQVGRFIYTGAPTSHTFSTERLEPSFLEVQLFQRTPEQEAVERAQSYAQPLMLNPNEGHSVTSTWEARYRRHLIPVAIPLFTIDLRDQNLGDQPGETVIDILRDRYQEAVDGARIRLRFSVPLAQRSALDETAIQNFIMSRGAESARILVETKPEVVVRSEDIHAGVTFHDGLDMWLKTQPAYADYKTELASVAYEVDDRLTPEQRQLMEPVDVETLRVGWSNFKQYGPDNVVDFRNLKGLVAVIGPNMGGKSNFAELPAFVRWGALRASLSGKGGRTKLQHAVRTGQKVCTAWEEFQTKGQVYRIDRSVTWTGKSLKGTLTLAQLSDDVADIGDRWIPISGSDANETKKKIQALVGTLDQYLSTSFSSQFDLTRILEMGEADFQTTLQEACNTTVWETRLEVAKELDKATTGELGEARGRRDREKETADLREERAGAVKSLEEQLQNHVAACKVALEARDQCRERLDAIRHETARLGALEERHQERQKVVAERKTALDRHLAVIGQRRAERSQAEMRLGEAEKSTREVPMLEEAVQRLQTLEDDLRALMETRQKRDALLREANAFQATALREKGTHQEALGKLQAQRHHLAQKLSAAELALNRAEAAWHAQISAAQADLENAKKRAGLLDDVGDCTPPDLRKHASAIGPTLNESCPLLQDAIGARDRIAALQAHLDAVKQEPQPVTDAKVAVADAKAAVEAKDAEIAAHPEKSPAQAEAEQAQARVEAEITALGFSESLWEANTKQISALQQEKPRERLAALREAQKSVDDRRAALAEATAALEAAKTEEGTHRAAVAEAEAALRETAQALESAKQEAGPRLAAASKALQTAEQRLQTAEEARTSATTALGAAKERLETAEKASQALEELNRRVTDLERRLTVLGVLRQACSRTGIPYLILEKALPLFETMANRYLDGTELQVRVTAQGDEGIERMFLDDKGEHPMSEASGFGKSILGLVMRWALCNVAATFTGTKVRQFTQDEGFGAFDQHNLINAQRMLREMVGSGVETFLVISHIPAVVESADHVLTVIPDPKGHYLEGPGASVLPPIEQETLL